MLSSDKSFSCIISSKEENVLTSAMGTMSLIMLFSPMASSVFWSMIAMRGIMFFYVFSTIQPFSICPAKAWLMKFSVVWQACPAKAVA